MNVYLIQAQLAAYRNLVLAHLGLKNARNIPAADPDRKAASLNLKELNRLLTKLGAKPDGLLGYWRSICQTDPAP